MTAAAGGLGASSSRRRATPARVAVGVAGGPPRPSACARWAPTSRSTTRSPGWPERVREGLGERELTVVLEGVGGELGRAAMELLGLGGRMLLFGFASGSATEVTTRDLMARGLTVTWAIPRALRRPGGLRELETRALAEAAAGRLVPLVARFPLAEAAAAHEALRRGNEGKTVLCHDPLHLRDLRDPVLRLRGAAAELPGVRGRAPVRARERAAVDDARGAARPTTPTASRPKAS